MHVVHRDVSPGNIFVTYKGGVKVVDFSIAYAQEKVHHTKTGTLKGNLGYMAPELIAGDGRDLDRRADVWGLGVCLWEMEMSEVGHGGPAGSPRGSGADVARGRAPGGIAAERLAAVRGRHTTVSSETETARDASRP